jgi:hypothetical protein
MDLEEIQKFFEEAKSKLYFYIKNEVKRKVIGETYNYLVKIPDVAFWIATVVTTFILLAVELVLAGLVYGQRPVIYGELLLGFAVAAGLGIITGWVYSRRVSRKIHAQIAEILKHKSYKSDDVLDDSSEKVN